MPRRNSESDRTPVQEIPESTEGEPISETTGSREHGPQDDRPNLPTHVVRLGLVRASVWLNQTEQGPRYNVSVSRLYMGGDQRWHSTASFGLKDLLPLAKVVDQAHTWISEQLTAEAPFDSDRGQGSPPFQLEGRNGTRSSEERTFGVPSEDGALATAMWLLDCDLWPVAIRPQGKSPIGRNWGRDLPSATRLRSIYRQFPDAGVGIALGPLAGVIDLEVDDGEGARPFFDRLFAGDPPPTLGWRSARGDHRLYRWDSRIERLAGGAVVFLAGGAVELRLGGHGKQVAAVCPPSKGCDGRRREWNGIWQIAPLPEQFLEELARRKASRVLPRVAANAVQSSRYAAAALEREAGIVREANVGARNRTLNRAAYSLGQLVASGMLERGAVEAELTDAALATGLPEKEITETLRSGIEAGLRKPRTRGQSRCPGRSDQPDGR